MVDEARQRVDADVDADADIRMRFGVYFYAEPVAPKQDAGTTAPTPRAKRGNRRTS
jgi:hypothetical protein